MLVPLRRSDASGKKAGSKKVRPHDLFTTPDAENVAKIFRLAVTTSVEEAAALETQMCRLTQSIPRGFKGNGKIGGTPAQQKQDHLYGVSVLVMRDLKALNIAINPAYIADPRRCAEYARLMKAGSGHSGLTLPPLASAFAPGEVPTRCEISGCYVLGGKRVVDAYGSGEALPWAMDFASPPPPPPLPKIAESRLLEAINGGNVYFSGKSPTVEQIAFIKSKGGSCFVKSPPATRDVMTLLIVQKRGARSTGKKYKYALRKGVPIASCEQLATMLPGGG
jgi:hypothetical protein